MKALMDFDIQYVKGIGPQRADLLKRELGIRNAYDLLRHYPNHYVDRSQFYNIKDFTGEMPMVQVKGRFISFSTLGEGRKMRLIGLFTDGITHMEVVWFNRINSIRKSYNIGTEYIIFGKPALFGGRWSMVHPEVDTTTSIHANTGLRGVYPLTEKLRNKGIGSRQFYSWTQAVISVMKNRITETLPAEVVSGLRLMSLADAFDKIHNPTDNNSLQRARLRLKFEELFFIQLDMLRRSMNRKKSLTGFRFTNIGKYFNDFYYKCLPFELTGAQKRVIKEIRADVNTGRQMNRLVQGDVGSGKTLVALLSMLIALDNNAQACLMAPTEILAGQHFETISKMVEPIGINVALLTGSIRGKKRQAILEGVGNGSIQILIGTHAVIEDTVKFHHLGFVVIDEQHRFGVAQRARLWGKNTIAPHVLVMTATPIPRTLAMTVYGDLDVSVIDELPPGRKQVETLLRYDNQRFQVYCELGKQLKAGRQVYIVYPLIEENEKLDLKSLEEGYELVRDTFSDYKVAYVHGKMKPAEKDYQMGLFASHQADILVATTVIEVGVNVPNATVMLIENAERFGLSQLHQLRGRVGRGADQSFCILMTKYQITRETRKRLEVMTSTTDGFIIAEEDMKMRGPGDIEGTMQSGIPFDLHIANLAADGQIIQLARNTAEKILDRDPELSDPANRAMKNTLSLVIDRTKDWSLIS